MGGGGGGGRGSWPVLYFLGGDSYIMMGNAWGEVHCTISQGKDLKCPLITSGGGGGERQVRGSTLILADHRIALSTVALIYRIEAPQSASIKERYETEIEAASVSTIVYLTKCEPTLLGI